MFVVRIFITFVRQPTSYAKVYVAKKLPTSLTVISTILMSAISVVAFAHSPREKSQKTYEVNHIT